MTQPAIRDTRDQLQSRELGRTKSRSVVVVVVVVVVVDIVIISATIFLIHSMFGSRVGFMGSADPTERYFRSDHCLVLGVAISNSATSSRIKSKMAPCRHVA